MPLLSKETFYALCQTKWVVANLILHSTCSEACLNWNGKNRPCLLRAKIFIISSTTGQLIHQNIKPLWFTQLVKETAQSEVHTYKKISKWMWKLIPSSHIWKTFLWNKRWKFETSLSFLAFNFRWPTSAQEDIFFHPFKKKSYKAFCKNWKKHIKLRQIWKSWIYSSGIWAPCCAKTKSSPNVSSKEQISKEFSKTNQCPETEFSRSIRTFAEYCI